MRTFIVPSPDDIIPNDRSSFTDMHVANLSEYIAATRKMLWLEIMDQLVEGSALIVVNFDLDETRYVLANDLREEFEAKGFITEVIHDANETIVIQVPESHRWRFNGSPKQSEQSDKN